MLTVDVSFVDEETFSISAGKKYGLSCTFISTLLKEEDSKGSFDSLSADLGSTSSLVSSEADKEDSFLLRFTNQETKYLFDQVLENKKYYANASAPIVSSEGLVVKMKGIRAEIELIFKKMFSALSLSTLRKKPRIILSFDFAGGVNAELDRVLPLDYKGQRCMCDTDEVNKELGEMASSRIFESEEEEDPDLNQLLGKMCISDRNQFFSSAFNSDDERNIKRRRTQPGNSGTA